ncbi:MAG: phosphatase PAP2 family protein [Tannerellaceae bacterium]|jgi:undecaprenyl-diphosphatase|nr:phosphatase PAP2 family protein [Tannerellaceae bacterium]
MEEILKYERNLFFFLNGSDIPALDRFVWLYSGKLVWLPAVAFILFALIYKKTWKEYLLVLLAIITVATLCDQFSSQICKPLFARLRPTHHPDFMNEVSTVFGYRGGRYGFISSHAANSFGFAVYISLLFRSRFFTATITMWAILTAWSRIYLGVHFISDVAAGAISGIIFGLLVYYLYVKVRNKYIAPTTSLSPADLYSERRKNYAAMAIIASIIAIAILNAPLAAMLS